MRQTSLREHNLALLARTIADGVEPPSRADLAQITGLDRATVGRLVGELLDGRLVVEQPPRAVQRSGRPGRPLAPAPGSVGGLGLELNVDYVGARALDLTGSLVAESVVEGDLRDGDADAALAALAEVASDVASLATAAGVRIAGSAVAVPGLVDPATGTLLRAPNLGWEAVDVAGRLSFLPGGRPVAGNEAHLSAVAELAARDRAASFLYVSGEIGVGAAIVRGGEPFAGQHGWSGELGHLQIDPRGEVCRCGAVGCLETVVGVEHLLRAAGLGDAAAVADLVAAHAGGDVRARAAVAAAGTALGDALGSVVNVLDLSLVVLGNTLGGLTQELRPALETALTRRVLASSWAPPRLEAARVADRPAMTGAARSVLARVWADPAAWLATT